MPEAKATQYAIVSAQQGLHARAAVLIAETARRFQAEVKIYKDHNSADSKEILQIMTLGASHGTRLRLEATGPDAEAAVAALAELISVELQRIEQEDSQQTRDHLQRKKRRAGR